jgi:flagellar M-ring protein FliF
MADTMAIADASEILEDSNENASGALDVQKPKDVTPNTFVSSITSNPLIKRALPALVGLFGVLLFTVLYLTLTASGTRSLYPNMSEEDRSEAYAILQSNDMNVSIDQANGALQIAENQYYEARMLLAANGLPRDGSSQSIDALANASSITSTQFMEQAQYTAAIEAELSRSIERISTVRSARVHLAAPRQSSYIRNRQPAKASVVIETQPGRIISPSQVQAIVNLVASSIPYLSVDDVSVVDQLGTLLTNREQSGLLEANEQAEFKRNLEEDYRSKILGLLGPVYGVENIRADVDLSLDFTEFESTSEFFDRNGSGPSTRSEMLSQDLSSSTAAEGIPGSTTNVAPADTVLTEVDNNQSQNQTSNVTSSQTTRNYEVDREIQYQKNPSGNITRINVAVVINEEAFLGENASAGEETPQIDTTNIERLVARAAGVDESRGDNVMVLVSRFAEVEVIPVQWYENELYIDYIKLVTIFLFFIIFSLIVLRPVVYGLLGVPLKIKTKTKVSKEDTSQRAISDQSGEEIETLDEEEVPLDDGAVYDGGRVLRTEKEMLERAEETGETLEDIKARLKPRKTNVTADMFDTANTYDDKVAIVRVLVEEDASRVASLLKKMLNAPRN